MNIYLAYNMASRREQAMSDFMVYSAADLSSL